MKIPPDAQIPEIKLTRYLLVFKELDDKSKFLAQAGFTSNNPDALEAAIREHLSRDEALLDRSDEHGQFYRVEGTLNGTNGHILNVITVWVREYPKTPFRFITLKPWRKK
ncbi:MAG: hypothetical protein K8L97_33265 [Anaerolineae bacterium]|nr:hypothetical protein [Anaerolineae bacterium]